MELLEKSTEAGKYEYYHLISGQDYPLKSQKEIHEFFHRHSGMEFISCTPMQPSCAERIKFYYYFQDAFGGRTLFNKVVKEISIRVQRLLKTDRTKGKFNTYGIGAQWFSITDRMARYVVSCKRQIEENFYKCYCADEIFLQTIWLNAPFYSEELRYHSGIRDNPYIDEIYFDVMRATDWKRGTPYVFDEKDYELLINSGCLFARKMSEEKSMKLICMLKRNIEKANGSIS